MNKENFCVVVQSEELYEHCYYCFADEATREEFKALAEEADFYVENVSPDFRTSATDAFEDLLSIHQMCIEG